MTFPEAMKQACREHLARLPAIIKKEEFTFNAISRSYGEQYGDKAGTPQDQANGFIAATSWMIDKLCKLPAYDYGLCSSLLRFPYATASREPVGDEYLFTICLYNMTVSRYSGELIERARTLQLESMKLPPQGMQHESAGKSTVARDVSSVRASSQEPVVGQARG